MISSSPYYIVALLVICMDKCNRVKICSILCIFHIILENLLSLFFQKNIFLYDLGLYLNLLWAMDVLLVIACMLLLSGIRKKLIIFFCGIVSLSQMIFIQYPFLNDYISSLLINQGYFLFIESFILISAINFDTVKSILKSSTIVFLIIYVHLLN